MAGWPSSTGNNTMSKRSASRQQQFSSSGYRGQSAAGPPFDALIKDYTKKRWLILALLSVEVSVATCPDCTGGGARSVTYVAGFLF